MFLIERNGTAVLYTGDIRSEPWFVNSIARHPALIEYTSGIRRLHKIYLDTSFTEDVPFQTKREGIAELLQKVALYPPDTVFYFQTWTYGYEEVWLALSKALKSQIHVDEYKMGIYTSLSSKTGDHRFASLTGYMCGNAWHPGCLTADESVRLHSCEKGHLCSVASQLNVVKIQPIVARLADGTDIAEAGVGGGGNDFQRDAELGSLSKQDVRALQELLKDIGEDKEGVFKSLAHNIDSGRDMPLSLAIEMFGERLTTSIDKLGGMLARKDDFSSGATTPQAPGLPRVIRFPYARHSSYQELCHFVDAFKPLDVWPCTEDAQHWWRKGHSIASYFGEFCTGNDFAYDRMVQALYPDPPPPQEDDDTHDTQTSEQASLTTMQPPSSPARRLLSDSLGADDLEHESPSPAPKRARTADQGESQHSTASHIMDTDSAVRWDAYNRTLDRLYDGDWGPLPLLSTTDHHSKIEQEL
ncbi:DNA repair metallo-beta-lactamase [Akanthomyces lecanii RCEF 1005]|uniref:DNA repair metallo-beta-lactamase n=1 Tax=Akanthomyces lecanii RCEF 1005 TaxID=1081108 RepID=A0A168HZ15_CORDF|nr:DNA repair metallo-beta-lactamase [Akanthomyces lecanii RCEF 1005]